MDKTPNKSQSSLLGIFINILLPVLILDYCSAGPANPLERPEGENFWHIGPVWALVIALSLPLVYGIRSLVVSRKFDLMSVVGMAGVLLPGVISRFVIGPDGRIHGRVITNGAVTGRCTHNSPNLAQIPARGQYGKQCRALFAAPPPLVQVGADASGLELRMLAHYLAAYDGGAYAKVLLEGDIHTANQHAAGLETRDNAKTFILTARMTWGKPLD